MATPYDQAVKLLSEEDPRGFLSIVAGIPIDATVEVLDLPKELVQDPMEADQIYLVRPVDAPEFLVHTEAWSRHQNRWKEKQLWYGVEVVRKFRLPLQSYVVFLKEKGVPKRLPSLLRARHGDVDIRVRVRPIRLWMVDAGPVLETNRRPLYPWVPLMNSTLAQQREAARRISAQPDTSAAVLLAILARLRYDDTEAYLESIGMILTPEILMESPFTTELIAKTLERGRQEGRHEGRQEGRHLGEHDFLHKILEARFGPLPVWAEERLQSATDEDMLRWALKAPSAESLESALADEQKL
jgi:predicted transposase YdaD